MIHDQPRSLGKMVVGNILRTAAERFADREALYCAGTGRRFTFRDVNSRSNQLAHALLALALQQGEVVAFICSNRVEILEIYGALAKSGMVGLPLNYRLAPAEMATLINEMGAVAVICEAGFGKVLDHLRVHSPALRHYIWIGPAMPAACLAYNELQSSGDPAEPDIDIDETAPYYFNLTSGTTGLPKSYVISHYSSCSLLSAILSIDTRPDDVFLTVFPAFGRVAFGSLLMSLITGTRNVLANFEPRESLRLIHEESVTFLWLVPTMATLMLDEAELDKSKLASLRGVGSVGAMLTDRLREQIEARLCRWIYEGYGLQETGMLTISTPDDRVLKPGSVGRPPLFSEVQIVNAEGARLPPGEVGEILGRSPNCISAYFNSPANNSAAFQGGWFHTGDLGRLDTDGHLYICGRVKDMIISGGQNVHASEIEATLLAFPGVSDCAVIGLPDETWGEVVTAVIVAHGESSLAAQPIQDFCRKALAGFKVPRRLVFQQDPLPRTATGKVQKFLLVQRYSEASREGC